MKFITIIFSFYMTLLAVMPCRDTDDFGDLSTSNTSLAQSHSDKEKTSKETCTPFCTCACCSTVRTVTSRQPVIQIFIQQITKTYAVTQVPAILEQSISVWQPPQIG
ncbi:DUF6660 family protein [uncultured Mucilaginibacter sp.]|uniref:DUF6660 family protein n=1 Tax=uncultured Mucilaginibacter sp. TaxID=797541 RepID=UPI00342C2E72